ncbi:hypothetical protein SAMN04489740_2706 [Arthrobacter alpinus]|uniref:Uncharacterized protein n=1 Tax=Arthrobacter alpinus TaxID=656366 RepID=A0A1H5M134_9MICC|nr:hypothetical protein SAMN04489740_2706 [Arthrobacter alpinus]
MNDYEVRIVPHDGTYPWWGELRSNGIRVNQKPFSTLRGAERWSRRTLKALRKLDKLNDEFKGKAK